MQKNKKRLLIVGAGEAGRMVVQEILAHKNTKEIYELVGFLDDDTSKPNVVGSIENAHRIIMEKEVDEVIIAIPSAGREEMSRIVLALSRAPSSIKIVPGLHEIIQGSISLNQIRTIAPIDLLGREEVGFDIEKISPFYKDKIILVTGAGGSIGSEILTQLIGLPIKRVTAFGRGENSIHDLIQKYGGNKRFDYIIGDMRDEKKVLHEFKRIRPDIIFHAAAHKHVALMENFPDEAIKNNILGTYHCAKAAIEAQVSRFIFVSTDKAVNPTSIMGASKRIAEKIVLSLGSIQNQTYFSLTRFGNVLGSRGSVIPIFKRQLENGGPLTVTDPEVTRFFMSIREAARLVVKSATIPEGKVCVLDMGEPIKILDLAKNFIHLSGQTEEEIPITFTGLKQGEKMYEEVLSKQENLDKTTFSKLLVSHKTEDILDTDSLAIMLAEFKESAETYSPEVIKKTFKKYIPEYLGAST